ncbi:MAG TPA: glutathione S-transferase family protein [Gammaproteobacteria bacterium]|nr:glutathione S-transferase family protein [Gammaproteobacteria bacterium]
MPALYHFWSSPHCHRIRLVLGYKAIGFEDHPLRYDDDATFFELGVARTVPVLRLDDGRTLTDTDTLLWEIDSLFPGTEPLVEGRIDQGAWDALLQWRAGIDALLRRLYAPVLPAYEDIGGDEDTLHAYKQEVAHRFGMGVEELANDRYAGYAQLERMTHLKELARHLAQSRFYLGEPSIADAVLAADLYPLQLLDGITLPLDLMYYFTRVEQTFNTALNEGLIAHA